MMHTLIQVLLTMLALSTPCEYEDSNNCYWDATTAGINGIGHSFTATESNGVACVNYWDPRVKDYCEASSR